MRRRFRSPFRRSGLLLTRAGFAALRGLTVALAAFLFAAPARRSVSTTSRIARTALAAASYKKPDVNLPKELQELTYDQYRDIRFRPDRALWRAAKLPFELMFFHPGLFYNHAGAHRRGRARRRARTSASTRSCSTTARTSSIPKALRDLGFAGFRVHYPLNTPKYKDEVLVFLGASYFRALGKGQRYGLSARGLAIDTASTSGEEFPRFTEFWIERPEPQARRTDDLRAARLAARDRRLPVRAAARRRDTVIDVQRAALSCAQNVAKLGIAPLTSMFFFGENQPRRQRRLPPGGARLRRPVDPDRHRRVDLAAAGQSEAAARHLVRVTNPRGFGLMQRDRASRLRGPRGALRAAAERAGSSRSATGAPGRVELVQLPTPDETNDNIVAYWVPDAPPAPQQPLDFGYRMLWQKDNETRPPLALGRADAPRPRLSAQARRQHFGRRLRGSGAAQARRRRAGQSRRQRRRERRDPRDQRRIATTSPAAGG